MPFLAAFHPGHGLDALAGHHTVVPFLAAAAVILAAIAVSWATEGKSA